MKVVTVIQARMGSTRLPGKVMLQLEGKTVLAHVVERCKAISLSSEIVVATTTKAQDNIINIEADKLGVLCHRGSEDDVLSRYYEAAVSRNADVIVRVTSDCPLLDPDISNLTIEKFLSIAGMDYCDNVTERTFPRGLDTEVISFSALERAYNEAQREDEREHVCHYIYEHPEWFKLTTFSGEDNLSNYRWTLDTEEDWKLIQEIYRQLYIPGEVFSWKECIKLMERNPHLIKINANVEQKV